MYIFLVGKHLFQRSKNPMKLLRQTTLLSTTTVAMPMQAPAPAPAVMLRRVSVRTRQSMRNDRQSRAHSLTATWAATKLLQLLQSSWLLHRRLANLDGRRRYFVHARACFLFWDFVFCCLHCVCKKCIVVGIKTNIVWIYVCCYIIGCLQWGWFYATGFYNFFFDVFWFFLCFERLYFQVRTIVQFVCGQSCRWTTTMIIVIQQRHRLAIRRRRAAIPRICRVLSACLAQRLRPGTIRLYIVLVACLKWNVTFLFRNLNIHQQKQLQRNKQHGISLCTHFKRT